MILDYNSYKNKGGNLEEAAFNRLKIKAENFIKGQSMGEVGKRLNSLSGLPSFLSDLVFDLIEFFSNAQSIVSSESQSMGGMSESKSYKSDIDIENQANDILRNYFYSNGYGDLLYRGIE